jgi:hypothetical protein
MDRFAIRRRALWYAASSPAVVLLAGLGTLWLFTDWLLGTLGGSSAVAGAGLLTASGLLVASRWLFTRDRLLERARRDLQDEAEHEHSACLHRLERRFRGDPDLRPQRWLRQMRRLYQRLQHAQASSDARRFDAMAEPRRKAAALYRSCLAGLERAADLREAAAQMSTPEARGEVLASRQTLLDEVEKSLRHIGACLDRLDTAALQHETRGEELRNLRQDLDADLEIADRVKSEMSELDEAIGRLEDRSKRCAGFESLGRPS